MGVTNVLRGAAAEMSEAASTIDSGKRAVSSAGEALKDLAKGDITGALRAGSSAASAAASVTEKI